MRRDLHRRLIIRSAVTLALAGGGLALALGLGLPDPGVAERAFAGFAGVLGVLVAWSWLRTAVGERPLPRAPTTDDDEGLSSLAPTLEAAATLERAIGFGVTTMGSFDQLVRPRLRALAEARLARAGCALENEAAARRLLGDDWALIGPARPVGANPLDRGVEVARLERLVDILERLS